MEEKKKKSNTMGWLVLIILIALMLGLNYIKFFANIEINNIEEKPSNTDQSEIIAEALNNIVDNINEYQEETYKISAALNQNSIFISYETKEEGTYEFNYNNLIISITIPEAEANKKEFKEAYKVLAKSVQKRLNNEINIDNDITAFLENKKEYEGLKQEKNTENSNITYSMNITKKIETTNSTTETN